MVTCTLMCFKWLGKQLWRSLMDVVWSQLGPLQFIEAYRVALISEQSSKGINMCMQKCWLVMHSQLKNKFSTWESEKNLNIMLHASSWCTTDILEFWRSPRCAKSGMCDSKMSLVLYSNYQCRKPTCFLGYTSYQTDHWSSSCTVPSLGRECCVCGGCTPWGNWPCVQCRLLGDHSISCVGSPTCGEWIALEHDMYLMKIVFHIIHMWNASPYL